MSLPNTTHPDWEARRDAWGAIVATLEDAGIPAAITTNPPMSGMNASYGFKRPGDENETFGQYAVISHDYFDVMGIPLLSGRTFHEGELASVVIISEGLAEAHFPGEEPVGKILEFLSTPHRIIGVVGSTTHFGPDSPEPPAMYVSYETTSWGFAHVVARGDAGTISQVVQAVGTIAPSATLPEVAPYEAHVSEWFRPLRIQLGIVGALGLVGGLLAGLGLYASIAWQVRMRLPELGIRVALGAPRRSILAGVLGRGLTSATMGLALGLAVWWMARGRLGEVLGSPDGAVSGFALGSTAVLILALSLVAVTLPGLRAMRADPLESLRAD